MLGNHDVVNEAVTIGVDPVKSGVGTAESVADILLRNCDIVAGNGCVQVTVRSGHHGIVQTNIVTCQPGR